MSPTRINLGKVGSDLYQSVTTLERQANSLAMAAGITEGFGHLLRLRASQLNQCSYCVRMHTRDALKVGEANDRIAVIAAWRESEYFTPKERAALGLVEAITLVSEGQVSDAVYAESAAALSNEEIAAVEWIGIVINAWNRIAIASRLSVKP